MAIHALTMQCALCTRDALPTLRHATINAAVRSVVCWVHSTYDVDIIAYASLEWVSV